MTPRTGRRSKGFTMIELMIVVAILSILAAIAIPKFATMMRQANEGATKGKLRSMRSSLVIYYGEQEGVYPANLSPFTTPGSKYQNIIVPVYTHEHGNLNLIVYYSSAVLTNDTGGWGYVNNSADGNWGKIWVDCTHTDTNGRIWTIY